MKRLAIAVLLSALVTTALWSVTGSKADFTLGTTSGSPASGKVRIWANLSTGMLECINSSGTNCFSLSDPTHSAVLRLLGLTSGEVALGVKDIAGTAISYILPSTNGTTGQYLIDTGSTTCPTLPAGSPATCHLLGWSGGLTTHSVAWTTVLADAGGFIDHPAADTTARVWTIDSNANVPYILPTCITFINEPSAGTLTISITSDTMFLAGAGTTGSRTLTAGNVATACKYGTTLWMISGSSGLT